MQVNALSHGFSGVSSWVPAGVGHAHLASAFLQPMPAVRIPSHILNNARAHSRLFAVDFFDDKKGQADFQPDDFQLDDLRKPSMQGLTREDVLSAESRLQPFSEDLSTPTPLIYSRELSLLAGEGKKVYLKLENMRPTHSFKIRGALNAILANTERGRIFQQVVAASQGNHAQGVALASQLTEKEALIFMPENADPTKIKQTQSFGAEVKLVGQSLDDAIDAAKSYAEENGAFWLHPYDDQDVIAGQGTVGLEILDQNEKIDTIIVPAGGGGLLSGITLACPDQEVIGVQLEAMPSMAKSLLADHVQSVPHQKTIAGGIAVGTAGTLGVEVCKKAHTQMHLVSEDEVQAALCYLLSEAGLKVEGAGSVSVIPLMRGDSIPGDRIVLVISGSNIAAEKLAHCTMRE